MFECSARNLGLQIWGQVPLAQQLWCSGEIWIISSLTDVQHGKGMSIAKVKDMMAAKDPLVQHGISNATDRKLSCSWGGI